MSKCLDPQLLARYADARVPRYTSYPTAPHFGSEINAMAYRGWLGELPSEAPLSLYLHVPFCRSMCWYCGCHTTVTTRDEPIARYLASLQREVEMVREVIPHRPSAQHVHFGGGTPTLMQPAQFRSLMQSLRSCFGIEPGTEVAIEIDPRRLEKEMIGALSAGGVTRASLGVQSFDPVVQQAINRVQSYQQTAAATEGLREAGIAAVNFDLIYGLPCQTVDSCLDTVAQAVSLKPERFAVFGYAHVPAFKPHQRKIEAASLPGTRDRFVQARAIADALTSAGYVEIGLDHFALPGDPLATASAAGRLHRNFQGYTTDEAEILLGLGASSIGRLPQGYVQNEVRIAEYQRRIEEGRLPIARGRRFAGDDRVRGAIIERLMCDREVDIARVCRDFGTDPAPIIATAPLGPLVADGLVERDGARLRVQPHARPFIRSVAAAFDRYLERQSNHHSRAV